MAVASEHRSGFGDDWEIDSFPAGDAEDFRRSLEKRKLATNTIRRRIGQSKQFFGSAAKHRLISDNPFAEEASAVGANPEQMMMIPNEWIEHLIWEINCESLHDAPKDDREGRFKALAEAPSESQGDSRDGTSRQVSRQRRYELAG